MTFTNEKVRTALQGSIAKWEKIVEGTGKEDGWINCPLCKLFLVLPINCAGCPVEVYTGAKNCRNSPYTHWHLATTHDERQGFKPLSPIAKALAQEEVDFLKKLDQYYFVEGI